jgi:RNA polymerase sigma factor for flagellar operon FliA
VNDRLTRKEIDALFREYRRTRCITLRNRIAVQFVRLVKDTAMRMAERLAGHLDPDELIAFGNPGLLQAIDGYDPDNAAAFTTYAVMRIRGAIFDEIRALDHVPRLTRGRARIVREAASLFYAEHGRQPTHDELRETVGTDGRRFDLIAADSGVRGMSSLAEPVIADAACGREETMAAIIPARPDVEPGMRADTETMLRDIVLPRMGLRHALLMKCRFVEGMTLRAAGEALRMSEARASQIQTAALNTLRGTLLAREAA